MRRARVALVLCALAGCGDKDAGDQQVDAGAVDTANLDRLAEIAADYPTFAQDPAAAGLAFDRALGGDAFALIDATDPASIVEVISLSFVDPDAAALAANVHELAVARELFRMALVPLVDEAVRTLPEVDDEVLVAAGLDPSQFASDLARLQSLSEQASAQLRTHLSDVLSGETPLGGPGDTVPHFDATTAQEAALLAHELVHPLQQAGSVDVRGWDPATKEQIVGIPTQPTTDSVADELQTIVVLCSMIADDPSGATAAQVEGLQAALKVVAGPEPRDKGSVRFELLSSTGKALHDTAKAIINNLRA